MRLILWFIKWIEWSHFENSGLLSDSKLLNHPGKCMIQILITFGKLFQQFTHFDIHNYYIFVSSYYNIFLFFAFPFQRNEISCNITFQVKVEVDWLWPTFFFFIIIIWRIFSSHCLLNVLFFHECFIYLQCKFSKKKNY